ncbi:hypothetical protein [Micromonospora sp. LA-10]
MSGRPDRAGRALGLLSARQFGEVAVLAGAGPHYFAELVWIKLA